MADEILTRTRTVVLTLEVELTSFIGDRQQRDMSQMVGAINDFETDSNGNPHVNAHLAGTISREIRTYLDDSRNIGSIRAVVSAVEVQPDVEVKIFDHDVNEY